MLKIFSKMAKLFESLKQPFTSAIILCAGASTRFGSNKQMATVCGKTVAERTISVFQDSYVINEIILVVPKDDLDSYKELVVLGDFKKVSAIVTGGETRQLSALRGLKHISKKAKYVAIHDGARCLITEEIIEMVLAEAFEHKCATSATRMTDTVKRSAEDDFVEATVDREMLWTVQTPQIFEAELYQVASYNAKQKGIVATDDCMLLEAIGYKVKLVETGKENIKITHPADIVLAEYIINSRNGDNQ
ncbi:MAG: 2-C-methyl-D-erythritol 4-phosphate cytidylyltransferase [Clostridia bacterium]|nr:2-C-methyl-D-erythritol 4-phosphate cytidylyltransferase [Clostridia bacterium]